MVSFNAVFIGFKAISHALNILMILKNIKDIGKQRRMSRFVAMNGEKSSLELNRQNSRL